LKNLPQSLSETYERLLSKIEGTERKDMILRMFKWIVCAREPIHIEQMREAVAFTLEDLTYDSRKLPTDLNRLVRACGNLVVVDEESHVIQLAHHTVQQYLLQQNGNPFQFTIKEANIMTGELCVAYLSFTNFESQITRYAENKNTEMLALEKIASRGPMLRLDNPGQKIVRVLSTLRSPRPMPLQINMTQYVPPQRKTWQPANFDFLSYIVAHWLWHTIYFDVSDGPNNGQASRRDRLFKNLIWRKQLLFDFRPWGEFTRDDHEASSLSLIGWGLMANHLYLIRTAFYDMPLPSLWEMWKATCKKYSWAINAPLLAKDSNPWPGAPEHVPYRLNQLDLDYDSSYISRSPDLVWLFSRLVWASKKGHVDAMKELEFKSSSYEVTSRHDQLDSMIQYLGVVAAAAGNLELLQFLYSKVVSEPLHKFLVVSDLTKGDGWTAIEHATIYGHVDVVAYLVHQGKLPYSLHVLYDFKSFLEIAINDNHIKRVECALLLQKAAATTYGFEYIGSHRHASNLLVKAITNGQTEIVRLLLEHGADPNGNPEDPPPLIEAIRHSKDSIVSILLEYGCFLGNTAFGMPLTLAACLGNFSIARQLILSGADVFEGTLDSKTLVAMAYIEEEHLHKPKAYLQDENRYTMSLSSSPLYMACYYGHLPIVELLLSCGAAANFLSPSSIIWIKVSDTRPAKTSKINYGLDWLLNDIDAIQSIGRPYYYNPKPISKEFFESSWRLPIVAARTRNHEDITCLLLSSGALWPEEHGSLYSSYLGSLETKMEEVRSWLIQLSHDRKMVVAEDRTHAHAEELVQWRPVSW
jgi:ankyrin repeat protein